MVARRLIEALRSRDGAGQWAVTLLCEEPRAPYDRVALTSYFSGRDPEDLALGGQEIWDDPLVDAAPRREAATAIDRGARTVTTSDGRTLRLRLARPRDRLVRRGAAGAGQGPPRRVRLPHHRRRRRTAGVRRAPARERKDGPRRGRRRRPARARGGRGAAGPRRGDHGRRVRAAADAAAGRRGRRQALAPADQRPRRHRPHRRRDLEIRGRTGGWPGDGVRRRARRSTSTSSSSPPACGPRDELARDRRARRSASAAGSSSTRLPHADPRVWAIGEVACIEGRAWAWWRRATRWPRSSPTGCSG